jgi:hypothetical protein
VTVFTAGTGNIQFATAANSSFVLLETVTLTSAQASVEFANLNSKYAALGYQHLQIRAVTRNTGTSNGNAVVYRINGDTGSNYSIHWMLGNGSAVQSYGEANYTSIFDYSTVASDETANAFAGTVIDLLDAFETTKFKTVRGLGGRSTSRNHVSLFSGAWRNTNAVTSFSMAPANGTWAIGTRIAIYGLKGS